MHVQNFKFIQNFNTIFTAEIFYCSPCCNSRTRNLTFLECRKWFTLRSGMNMKICPTFLGSVPNKFDVVKRDTWIYRTIHLWSLLHLCPSLRSHFLKKFLESLVRKVKENIMHTWDDNHSTKKFSHSKIEIVFQWIFHFVVMLSLLWTPSYSLTNHSTYLKLFPL